MVVSTPRIAGRDLLDGISPERFLIVGQGLNARLQEDLHQLKPGARIFSLDGAPANDLESTSGKPLSLVEAAAELIGESYDAILVARDFRKLKVLALLLRARQRFVLRHGQLEVLHPTELVWQQARALEARILGGVLSSGVRRARRATRRRLAIIALGEGVGRNNDYGFIERRISSAHSAPPRLRVSVVIPVYNRRAILEKTLAALTLQTYPRELVEVVVADDGSSDHPEELRAVFSGVLNLRFVRQADLGFRAAAVRNLGIRSATGDVIVLLDCDMLPVPGLIESMARWFHACERPLVVIGDRKFVNTDRVTAEAIRADFGVVSELPARPAPSAIALQGAASVDWRRPIYERSDGLKTHAAPYRMACSGNLAFWRRDAVNARLFDESYSRWGGEDIEFGYRLYRRGAYFVPELSAVAYHQEHDTTHVREEDAKVTVVMTRNKIPHRRQHELEGERFEVPSVSVIAASPGAGAKESPLASSLRAQTDQDWEVLWGGEQSDATEAAHRGDAAALKGRSLSATRLADLIDASRAEFVFIAAPDSSFGEAVISTVRNALERDELASAAITPGARAWLEGDPRELDVRDLHSGFACLRVRDWYRALATAEDTAAPNLAAILGRWGLILDGSPTGRLEPLAATRESQGARGPIRSHLDWRGAARFILGRL